MFSGKGTRYSLMSSCPPSALSKLPCIRTTSCPKGMCPNWISSSPPSLPPHANLGKDVGYGSMGRLTPCSLKSYGRPLSNLFHTPSLPKQSKRHHSSRSCFLPESKSRYWICLAVYLPAVWAENNGSTPIWAMSWFPQVNYKSA
jgi:hypothetical protein